MVDVVIHYKVPSDQPEMVYVDLLTYAKLSAIAGLESMGSISGDNAEKEVRSTIDLSIARMSAREVLATISEWSVEKRYEYIMHRFPDAQYRLSTRARDVDKHLTLTHNDLVALRCFYAHAGENWTIAFTKYIKGIHNLGLREAKKITDDVERRYEVNPSWINEHFHGA